MPPLRLLRLANPLVRTVLRSRAHGLLSRRLLLLAYRGRRSGRLFEIPLGYVEADDGRLVSVAVAPARKLWWRAFREPSPVFLVVRGERLAATGALAREPERSRMLERYVDGRPRVARVTDDAAVVVFAPTRQSQPHARPPGASTALAPATAARPGAMRPPGVSPPRAQTP